MRCLLCADRAENHHIKTRGAGGTDDDWNLAPLCRRHHVEVHQIGLQSFASKYIRVRDFLREHGWELDLNKFKHVSK